MRGNMTVRGFLPAQCKARLNPAHAAVARYDGILSAIPNPAVLLSPLSTQDAVLSSRIEGTQATMGEVLRFEAAGDVDELSVEKKDDIQEILNYRKAMLHGINMLQSLPLCQRIIRETHRVLMESVRGENKTPGEYRRIPNWIGPRGCSMEDARFVPISADKLADGMGKWENFLHTEQPDMLVQLAVLHAEFESIHPFLDGNGRLGRMIVPLFLYQSKLISSPMFYISAFFERNRDEYYDRLLAVSGNDDWTGWCLFFLKAVKEQALENGKKATDILNLYNDLKQRIPELTRSPHSMKALDRIFTLPIFSSSGFVDSAGIPSSTARRILDILRTESIIREVSPASGRRCAMYIIPSLLNIAEGHKAF